MTSMPRATAIAYRASILMAALIATAVVNISYAAGTETLPNGFTDKLVVAISKPTAVAFTPDGRTLIAQQPGRVRVIAGGTLVAKPAIDLSSRVCSDIEDGLLGI